MKQHKISVIIPTYKPGIYLKECIDSLKLQNTKFAYIDEVIIVLNGEIEGYLTSIYDYVDNWGIVKIIQTNISGVSNARNIGINNAIGDYILFVDDDDFVSENFVEGLFSKLRFNDSSIIVADFRNYNETNGLITMDYVSYAYKRCSLESTFDIIKFRGFLSSVCGKLISKDCIGEVRFQTGMSISEDGLFLFQISNKIKNIYLGESSSLYYRRLRDGSAMRKNKTFGQKTGVLVNSLINYSKVYLRDPLSYNFGFFLTRIMAVSKVYISNILK